MASQTNMEAKNNMAVASLQAALSFSNAILGATHAMVHQIDGLLDTHHGESNARVLPYVMEFNMISCPYKFKQIAIALGEDVTGLSTRAAAEKAISAVRCLVKDIGLGKGLAEIGLKDEHIPTLSRNAVKDACLITNPRDADEKDIAELFHQVL